MNSFDGAPALAGKKHKPERSLHAGKECGGGPGVLQDAARFFVQVVGVQCAGGLPHHIPEHFVSVVEEGVAFNFRSGRRFSRAVLLGKVRRGLVPQLVHVPEQGVHRCPGALLNPPLGVADNLAGELLLERIAVAEKTEL